MRHCVDDVLIVGPVASLDKIRVILRLQRSVDEEGVRRLEREVRKRRRGSSVKGGVAPGVPCRHPAFGWVALAIKVTLVESRARFEELSTLIVIASVLHELERVGIASVHDQDPEHAHAT